MYTAGLNDEIGRTWKLDVRRRAKRRARRLLAYLRFLSRVPWQFVHGVLVHCRSVCRARRHVADAVQPRCKATIVQRRSKHASPALVRTMPVGRHLRGRVVIFVGVHHPALAVCRTFAGCQKLLGGDDIAMRPHALVK